MRRLADVLKEKTIPFRTGVMTATLCTFRIGGRADMVIEPRCVGELIEAIRCCTGLGLPFAVIGKGSNLLFDDGETHTALIRTVALDTVRFFDGELEALCGVSLARLAHLCAKKGSDALSFAAGIPGTLGGAAVMNAGAHGKAIGELVKSVVAYDLESDRIKTLFNHQLNYSYRKSVFQSENMFILSARLSVGSHCDPCDALAKIRHFAEIRRATQPLDLPSAGSVFRRPAPGILLSKIMDELGLKGMRVGDAAVSQKHAGFIVNLGNARAADVKKLILQIQNIVEKERGIRPQPELCFIPTSDELFYCIERGTD